jgi:curved DNA-binding protein CbpA
MVGDGSAYAALGLEPDADSAEIERAYKRLIKQHHPDREGGDSSRAAEINRAYRELRAQRNLKEPLELHEHWPLAPRERRPWVVAALVISVTAIVLLLSQSRLPPLESAGVASFPGTSHKPPAAVSEPMEQPLHLAAIDTSAREAVRLSRTRDEMALASASADCHRLLRSNPSVLQLDRCAAFDDAVVQLQDRDPLRDQGPFSELAVTGRLWSGATELSSDSVAIDARFDRIRMRVELTIASSPDATRS